MTNSPNSVYIGRLWEVYHASEGDARFKDHSVLILDSKNYDPEKIARSGIKSYRCEHRTSLDGACHFVVDIYTDVNGTEYLRSVGLDINGHEEREIYDAPFSLVTHCSPESQPKAT